MADPEVKINIKTEYDGAAAERALLDIENLPLEAQGLAEVFNQNFAAVERMEEGLRAATASMREHIASLDPAAEGYEKAVAAAPPQQRKKSSKKTRLCAASWSLKPPPIRTKSRNYTNNKRKGNLLYKKRNKVGRHGYS